jgi:hypothetical protein
MRKCAEHLNLSRGDITSPEMPKRMQDMIIWLLCLHLSNKPLYPFYNDTLLTTGKNSPPLWRGSDVLITAYNNESSYFPFRLL